MTTRDGTDPDSEADLTAADPTADRDAADPDTADRDATGPTVDPLSRRRLLGGSASLASLAVLAGCVGDGDVEGPGADDGSEDRRDDDEDEDPGADDADPEPDDPPETVADGYDLDAALATTLDALETEPFTYSGFYAAHADGDTTDDAVENSAALTAIGDPTDREGRFGFGESDEQTVRPDTRRDATYGTDVYASDGSFTVRERTPRSDGEPEYSRDSGDYDEFVTEIGFPIEAYADVGDSFTFDDPRWDGERGVYVVEGTDTTTDELADINACTIEIDTDGVVVDLHVDVELDDGDRLRTHANGTFGEPVTVSEPSWLDEAEEAIAAEDEPDSGDGNGDGDDTREQVDETGRSPVEILVGAGDNGLSVEPANVRVSVGATVVWQWTGEGGSHNVVARDGTFESPLQSHGIFEHTFSEPGVYEYICEPHQAIGMGGRIEVVEE